MGVTFHLFVIIKENLIIERNELLKILESTLHTLEYIE